MNKVYNVGIIGIGKYDSTDLSYTFWIQMLRRCYTNQYPVYNGCSVCNEWLNFQSFAEWFDNNYIDNFQLDKDILVKGNKIYSPNTCCFVPQEINKLFVKSTKARGKLPIGVCFEKTTEKYTSMVNGYGRRIKLGRFRTPEAAFDAYKFKKEQIIKNTAKTYKDKISDNVFKALMEYQVEITD